MDRFFRFSIPLRLVHLILNKFITQWEIPRYGQKRSDEAPFAKIKNAGTYLNNEKAQDNKFALDYTHFTEEDMVVLAAGTKK